jgi:hypothetical protein
MPSFNISFSEGVKSLLEEPVASPKPKKGLRLKPVLEFCLHNTLDGGLITTVVDRLTINGCVYEKKSTYNYDQMIRESEDVDVFYLYATTDRVLESPDLKKGGRPQTFPIIVVETERNSATILRITPLGRDDRGESACGRRIEVEGIMTRHPLYKDNALAVPVQFRSSVKGVK